MTNRWRWLEAAATIVAGGLVGAALVYLPLEDPQTNSGGPLGPPTPDGQPADPTGPTGPAAPEIGPGDPGEAAPPMPVPAEEDWLDAHLRQAASVWVEAAESADQHDAPAIRALSDDMRALAKSAPPTAAELPPLSVLVPYLADELDLWLILPADVAGFPSLSLHMTPLLASEFALQASRSQGAVPIQ